MCTDPWISEPTENEGRKHYCDDCYHNCHYILSFYLPSDSIDFFYCRTCQDRVGEAKASGNLGNTLKVIGKFDEATVCCMRHLEISRELGDKVGNPWLC